MAMRVAVLFDNLGPYHVARLNAAAGKLDLVALQVRPQSYEYNWTRTVTSSFATETLLKENPSHLSWTQVGDALEKRLGGRMIDAIAVSGWSSLPALRAALWAHERQLPAIVMSDSNASDVRRLGPVELTKRRIVGCYSAGLSAGVSQRDYLVSLGLKPEAVFQGFDVVDNAYFAAGAAAARANGTLPYIGGRALPRSASGRYFLVVGRLLSRKNHAGLLTAYAAYRKRVSDGEPWPLVVVGDGPMRGDVERQRAALGLEESVFLAGHKQDADLPAYYGTAGAFMLLSIKDTWGLVVNEAMASGLPVVVSTRCGCASTLVRDGENGYAVNPSDTDGIADALLRVTDSDRNARMAAASRTIIANWDVDRFARGLKDAAEYAVAHRVTRLPAGHQTLCRMVADINEWRVRRPER